MTSTPLTDIAFVIGLRCRPNQVSAQGHSALEAVDDLLDIASELSALPHGRPVSRARGWTAQAEHFIYGLFTHK
ncbi:hypothetical protein [Geopseudomonas aromaticivorans]